MLAEEWEFSDSQPLPDAAALGSKIPTVELETTDGRRVNTADLIGKKLQLFEFGAIT